MDNKPRVIKDFEKLETEIQEQIKLEYYEGFSDHLISFTNAKGERVSALLFETEEKIYMVRMSISRAEQIIEDDDDYDDDGNLKESVKEVYEDKYSDDDLLSEAAAEEDDEEDDKDKDKDDTDDDSD